MAILDFLKKIKIPRFEDDFIQDQAEKAMEETPAPYSGKLAYEPQLEAGTGLDQDDPWDEKCRVIERHHDPSDPTSLMHLDTLD